MVDGTAARLLMCRSPSFLEFARSIYRLASSEFAELINPVFTILYLLESKYSLIEALKADGFPSSGSIIDHQAPQQAPRLSLRYTRSDSRLSRPIEYCIPSLNISAIEPSQLQ